MRHEADLGKSTARSCMRSADPSLERHSPDPAMEFGTRLSSRLPKPDFGETDMKTIEDGATADLDFVSGPPFSNVACKTVGPVALPDPALQHRTEAGRHA